MPSRSGAVLRWTVRLVTAACALAVALGALAVVGGWLPVDATALSLHVGSPWTRSSSDFSQYESVVRLTTGLPDRSIGARLTINQKSSSDSESLAFDVTASVSGPASNPLISGLRSGAGRQLPYAVIELITGMPTIADRQPNFAPPTMRTDTEGVTAVFTGSVLVPKSSAPSPIAVSAPPECAMLKSRVVAVTVIGFDIVRAQEKSNPYGRCSTGVWRSQSDTSVDYAGFSGVDVDLAAPAAPQSWAISPSSIISADHPVGRAGQALLAGLLAALPLLIVWRLLSRINRFPIVGLAVAAVGALLIFHAVVRVWLTAETAITGEVDNFTRLTFTIAGHPMALPLFDALTAALIATLVLVWRRAAVDVVAGPGPLPSRPIGRLMIYCVLLAIVIGVAAWSSSHKFLSSSRPASGWNVWLRGWPGLLAIGGASAATIGVIVAALLRRFARGFPASPVWLSVGAGLLFGVTQLIGYTTSKGGYSIVIDDYAALDWLSWTRTPSAWAWFVAMLFVSCVLLYLGFRWHKLKMTSTLLIWAGVSAALILLVIGLDRGRSGWVEAVPGGEWWLDGPGGLTVAAGGVVTATAGAAVTVAVLGGSAGLRGRAAVAAAAAAVLVVMQPLTDLGGLVGGALAAAVPILAGAFVWKALGSIGVEVLDRLPRRQQPRWPAWSAFLGVGGLTAILLSVPWSIYRGGGNPIDWTEFGTLVLGIDGCLPLFTVALVLIVSRALGSRGSDPAATRGTYRQLRTLAVAVAVAGLLTPSATAGGVPVAFLVGWLLIAAWLLPHRVPAGSVPLGDLPRRSNEEEITRQAVAAATLRATTAFERGLRKDLAAEGVSVKEREQRLNKIQRLVPSKRPESDAFNKYAGESPWHRACIFGLVGLLAGLPWLLLDLGALFKDTTGEFRVVDAAAGTLLVSRFAIAGFVLGLAFPMIRGRTGLAKGIALFLALAVPSLCATLLPDPHAQGVVSAAVLQVTQWLTFALALGLVADLRQLRASGLGWRSLSDVHNLTALTASFSSVVLAAVAATVTAIGTGAAGIAVERLLPPAPATASPAAATGK